MCIFNYTNNIFSVISVLVFVLAMGMIHIVGYFYVSERHFDNMIDNLEASPLFNLHLSDTPCSNSKVVFYTWGGRAKRETYYDNDFKERVKVTVYDVTDLVKVYGKYFCYDHISYRNLLRNGQIIKKGTECPSQYSKNCGRIDTLEQELCIKDTENCPLYDVSINNGIITYDNDGTNTANKKIIGRLILNDGQPCYKNDERLWRHFSSEEAVYTNNVCTNSYQTFGVYIDDRYEERGSITYYKLYEDNLSPQNKELVTSNMYGNEIVNLYKREFLGVDKECEIEADITKDKVELMKSAQSMEQTLSFVEGIIILTCWLSVSIAFVIMVAKDGYEEDSGLFCFIADLFYVALILACTICHIVFYIRIVRVDKPFECSDSETNKYIIKDREDNKYTSLFTKINLFTDIAFLGISVLGILFGFFTDILCNKKNSTNIEKNDKIEKKDINDETSQESKEIPLNSYHSNPTDSPLPEPGL